MPLGGIVLSGGLSSRFGSSKALVAFGAETMLERVVRQMAQVAAPVVIVAARDQLLPTLPDEAIVVRDGEPARGPLEDLRVGLAALQGRCRAAYLTGCDCPFLIPAFVHCLQELLGQHDIAVPEIGGIIQPLAAVYRVSLLQLIEQLLAGGRAGPSDLARRARTRIVTADELRQVDPQLETLLDVDEPRDYQAALRRAGLPAEPPTPSPSASDHE